MVMTKRTRVPKIGDRVGTPDHAGVFAVTSIDPRNKMVSLRSLNGQTVSSHVPWATLRYLDEEDVNQAAARIVRETTDKA